MMPFDCQPIAEVEAFIEKHYKGGSVIDFGCGSGRYAHCFPDKGYLGVDGHEENIKNAARLHRNKRFVCADLKDWGEFVDVKTREPRIDYLFSSVVFDQLDFIPKGWAKTYLLIEPERYREHFKIEVDEPLECAEGIRKVVAHDLQGVQGKVPNPL